MAEPRGQEGARPLQIFADKLTLYRGVSGRWAGWAIAHPVFGIIEGATGQRRRAALHTRYVLAHPVLGSQLRP